MDSAIEAVLRRYEERAAAETKRMQELPPAEFTKHIDEFLLAVGPATGQLMKLLIKEAKARTILELGTLTRLFDGVAGRGRARNRRQGHLDGCPPGQTGIRSPSTT